MSTNAGRKQPTEEALAVRRQQIEVSLSRVRTVLKRAKSSGVKLSMANIAELSTVSRSFLYQNSAARELVEEFRGMAESKFTGNFETHSLVASGWKDRCLNAESAASKLAADLKEQKTVVEDLYGKLLGQSVGSADISRDLVSENHRLKRDLHDVRQRERRLENALQGSRSNVEHLNRRLAELEVEILDERSFRP